MSKEMKVTREKHLDHMVRVVPFIVCAYAVQCWVILQMGPVDFAVDGLFFLGGMLVTMITAFVSYDLTHVVNLQESGLTIKVAWLGYEKSVAYQDIASVEVSEPGQAFATLTLRMKSGKSFGFFFVDEPDKIKAWVEEKKSIPEQQMAA